jgi:hypothetical protein
MKACTLPLRARISLPLPEPLITASPRDSLVARFHFFCRSCKQKIARRESRLGLRAMGASTQPYHVDAIGSRRS